MRKQYRIGNTYNKAGHIACLGSTDIIIQTPCIKHRAGRHHKIKAIEDIPSCVAVGRMGRLCPNLIRALRVCDAVSEWKPDALTAST